MSRASPARSARCGACMWLGECGSGGGVPHHQLHFRFQQEFSENVVEFQPSGGRFLSHLVTFLNSSTVNNTLHTLCQSAPHAQPRFIPISVSMMELLWPRVCHPMTPACLCCRPVGMRLCRKTWSSCECGRPVATI